VKNIHVGKVSGSEVKYKKYSPAMLEGFTDRCLTLEELLMWRVPK
jgi:hypothetical protein